MQALARVIGQTLGGSVLAQAAAQARSRPIDLRFRTTLQALLAGFDAWKAFSRGNPDYVVSGLMKRGTSVLSDAEAAAYDAPFPDARYRAGVRRFPEMVMVSPEAK